MKNLWLETAILKPKVRGFKNISRRPYLTCGDESSMYSLKMS